LSTEVAVCPFENGDRLTQAEFHRRYEACPEGIKAELIGGIVYMPSPLRHPHGTYHPELSGVLWLYKGATPGVEVGDNLTTILGDESEPQPDLALRILPEFGGQSRTNEDQYVVGPPEFVAEIAHSSRAIDMHQKRADYQDAGVREYLVLCVEEQELHWFHFKARRRITANGHGIYRSRVFPGLWIDRPALLGRNTSRLVEVIHQGLASREHAAFVAQLRAAYGRGV
jgi:Uma2 family endonuclease